MESQKYFICYKHTSAKPKNHPLSTPKVEPKLFCLLHACNKSKQKNHSQHAHQWKPTKISATANSL